MCPDWSREDNNWLAESSESSPLKSRHNICPGFLFPDCKHSVQWLLWMPPGGLVVPTVANSGRLNRKIGLAAGEGEVVALIPISHPDITLSSPSSKSRMRAWGLTTSPYLIGLGEKYCLPLRWCVGCVWQAGWHWTSHSSPLGLVSSYVKWGNVSDSKLFSCLPVLGHVPSVTCLPGRLFTAFLQKVSATQVLHHWRLLTWALGAGA